MKGCSYLLQIFEQTRRFFLFRRLLDVEDFHLHRLCPELDLDDIARFDLDGRLRYAAVHRDTPGIARFIGHRPPLDQAGYF